MSNDVELYDELYRTQAAIYDDPRRSPYARLYRKMVREVRRLGGASVLEVGCGSGTLAELALAGGITRYVGFDLSPAGIRKAQQRNLPNATFFVGDATDPACYDHCYDVVICAEVLEHIENDREVIGLWPPETRFVCSLPNFDYDTHKRYFRAEAGISGRYGDLLAIDHWERLGKIPWAGMTPREYFKYLRWARNDPKAFLGTLGFNTFEWCAGWFVFSGQRLR